MLIKNDVTNKSDLSNKALWVKNRVRSVYFDPNSFDFDNFHSVISIKFKRDIVYSLLFKIQYEERSFGMGAKQIPFILKSKDIDGSITSLFNNVKKILIGFMGRYRLEEIDMFQLLYVVMTDLPSLKLKNINKLALNREFFNVKDSKESFNNKLLPLTTNTSYYGKLVDSDEYLTYINIINSQHKLLGSELEDVNIIDSMHIYMNDIIIISEKVDTNNYIRRVYSMDSGILYFTAKDTIFKDSTFSRTIGKTTFVLGDRKLISLLSYKELASIKYKAKSYKASSNPYIGSLDLETYKDKDGLAKVYAIGFYTKLESNKNSIPITYYLTKDITSTDLVLKCIDKMLTSQYNNYTFYAHNFGNFDAIFILKILLEANIALGTDYYNLNYTIRDNRLLKLDIKVTKKVVKNTSISTTKEVNDKKVCKVTPSVYNPTYKISILDSYNMLSGSLYNLSRSFGLDIIKDHFPHDFVNRDTLYYVGNTPSISYWDGVDINEYNSKFTNNWNLKEECLKYLNKDLISLYKLMETFNKYVYINYGIQMTDSLTISRLALNIFLKDYLKEYNIPIINKNVYVDIKKAYFGGITEVYKPYGKNLYYYDVNSLYPFASLNPLPGTKCTYLEDFTITGLSINKIYGFFYCEIETEDNYLGLLPVHSDIELIMPNGKWRGWYYSEEIRFAINHGYKITILKGYNFNKEYNIFDEYVKDLYKIKSTTVGAIKVITKSLLNNLLGRFGLNIYKPVTEIVESNKLNILLSTCNVQGLITNITENDMLVTYDPTISKELCDWHNLNYVKVLNSKYNNNNTGMEKDREFKDVSIAIAAAVTSNARIYMSNIKLDILKNGGNIYYTDTDSIVTDKPLTDELVGKNIGQFKLEHSVKEGYFISSKTYCLVLNDDSVIIKAKGVRGTSLSLKDFKDMYKGINVKGIKTNTITNYEQGSVIIDKKEIDLNHNSYRKRDKIFKEGSWVDTKPIYYNESVNTSAKNKNSEDNNKGKLQKNTWMESNIIYTLLMLIPLSLSFIYFIYIANIYIDIYNEYLINMHNIKMTHYKSIIDTRLCNINYNTNLLNDNYINLSNSKLSKFIETIKLDNIYTKRLNILDEVKNLIHSNCISFTPFLEAINTLRYTDEIEHIPENSVVEAWRLNNPLGIMNLNREIDDIINLLDNIILENKTRHLEFLDYHKNAMFTILNRMSPRIH